MRLQQALMSLCRSVVSRALRAQPAPFVFVPEFSDSGFVASLDTQQTTFAADLFGSGLRPFVPSKVTRAFRVRRCPLPLIAPSEAAALAAQVRTAWREAAIQSAQCILKDGVNAYSVEGIRLDTVAGWRSIPKGISDDALFPIRPHRFAFLPQFAHAAI